MESLMEETKCMELARDKLQEINNPCQRVCTSELQEFPGIRDKVKYFSLCKIICMVWNKRKSKMGQKESWRCLNVKKRQDQTSVWLKKSPIMLYALPIRSCNRHISNVIHLFMSTRHRAWVRLFLTSRSVHLKVFLLLNSLSPSARI